MKPHQITRIDFLKSSGLIAGGSTFLPHTVWALVKESQENMQVIAGQLAEYQIVVPDQTNPVEQQAAEKLRYYLAEILHKDLAIRKETIEEVQPSLSVKRDMRRDGRLISGS